jgi:hypothetical protein
MAACLLLWPLGALGGSKMDESFKDAEAVATWAKSTFVGGFNQFHFARGDKELLVIVGQPSSGIATSEIHVFDRSKDGGLRSMLCRRRLFGVVRVKEDGDNIIFSGNSPILIIPWTGVVRDMEQLGRP